MIPPVVCRSINPKDIRTGRAKSVCFFHKDTTPPPFFIVKASISERNVMDIDPRMMADVRLHEWSKLADRSEDGMCSRGVLPSEMGADTKEFN